MFSPDAAVPSSMGARNPRRRQRTSSEDSVAIGHNPKRVRRSVLNPDTFKDPATSKLNGHIHHDEEAPYTNGHAKEPESHRHENVDTTSLAIRHKGVKKAEREKRSNKNDGTIELTKNENYVVNQLPTTPESLHDYHTSVVSDGHGKSAINVQFMRDSGTQSGGVFGSLKSVFSSAGWRKDVAAVRAGASWQRGQRYVIVATTRGAFQTWDLNWNGTHTLVDDVDAKNDILKALLEGADVFQDQNEHHFEVLDVTIMPGSSSGKEVAKLSKSGDCKLMALTVFKGKDSSKYALIGLTLGSGFVTIDVVHPVTCYTTSLSSETHFKPQVLVPEPTQTAFVIFEKSIVLVSLVEIPVNPSSQLMEEAHTLPDPFQDVIDFNKTKPYKAVGCTVEVGDRGQGQSSCAVMVYGFGMIRISAMPMKEGQSTLDRATVTAKTKIEQAVFFGTLQQDLLDFTPRPELRFQQEEVEAAALEVSHSIMSSSSAYIPAITPSMDQQLQQRSRALADLNKYIRQHYPPLSIITRWKLLWSAEKMASAKAIWKCYDAALGDQNKGSDERTLLPELIEAIHEENKDENQPDRYETDAVRHWFIHDIWRLQYVVPWAQDIVELLFAESVEDDEKMNLASQARFVSEANDIQLAALETAFKFREMNMATYGLEQDSLYDGILKSSFYDGLPEIWTSTATICDSVKKLTDLSRELTRLGEDAEGGEGEPKPDLILKLAADNPRQVQICCQTWIEKSRWLKARPEPHRKEQGEKLMRAHFAVRKTLFASLCDVGQAEEGIKLAEKYRDMDALANIIEQEIESAEDDATIQLFEQRAQQNFVKFGVPWADAFFKKTLDGGRAVQVLTNNANFKQHLTHFLRNHSRYAKLAWINDVVSERNYAAAADNLNRAEQLETNLWSRKIAFSLGKLNIMAAVGKGQANEEAAQGAIEEINEKAALVAVQENMFKHIKPNIPDAIDAEAEAELAMKKYGNINVENKPILRNALEHGLRKLLAMETLPAEYLIAVLTLVDDEGASNADDEAFMGSRFFSALKVVRASDLEKKDAGYKALHEAFIWRRCMIQDNWEGFNRTEFKDEVQVEAETGATALFKTLREGYRTGFWDKQPPLPPSSLLEAGTTVESLRTSTHFAKVQDNALQLLAKDLEQEASLLESYIEKGRLEDWWKGVVSAAKDAARAEADRDGEEALRRRDNEEEFLASMAEKDKEMNKSKDAGNEIAEVDDQGDILMDV
ncbi:hypothetical protein P7C71_g1625, partial [Lecanoromycetidae sp. Uapishka_2]